MKKILLTLSSFICASAMYAAVVQGNIGQGPFVVLEGMSSSADGVDFDDDGNIDCNCPCSV